MLNSSPSAMHSLPSFAVLEGESRHKSSAKQQQSAMFVSDILEKLSLSPRSAHQSPLSVNHQIITSFGQQKSFLNSCYHSNLKHKVKNLVPMTMHHCRRHWSRALYQVLVRMLMQKKPLLTVYNSLTHCRIPMNNDFVLLWLRNLQLHFRF